MRILLRLVYVAVIYAVVSGVLFPVAYVATGFPFFPKNLVVTRNHAITFEAPRSEWLHILFFREGVHESGLLNSPKAEVRVTTENGISASVNDDKLPVQRLNYYFQERQAGQQISGYAYGKFWAEKGSPVRIEIEPTFSGYDGVIVRTGFKRMFVSIGVFIFGCLVITGLIFWVTQRPVMRMLRR